MPVAGVAMFNEAAELDMVHGENHRGSGTGLAQHRAQFGNPTDRRPFSAEMTRNLNTEQALGLHRFDSLTRESTFKINSIRMLCRDRSDTRDPDAQIFFRDFDREIHLGDLSAIPDKVDGLGNRRNTGEGLAIEEIVRELDIESFLDAKHQLHRSKGGEAGSIEIGIIGHLINRNRQFSEFRQEFADCRIHSSNSKMIISRWAINAS
jgi:hypothetical protein